MILLMLKLIIFNCKQNLNKFFIYHTKQYMNIYNYIYEDKYNWLLKNTLNRCLCDFRRSKQLSKHHLSS